MLYAVLCYHDEAAVDAMTGQQEDALMQSLTAVHGKLSAQGKLAQAARLMPTTAAVTFRQRSGPWVVDGPFAETKEALLGFYILDCATLDEAIEAARLLDTPRSAAGLASALEIRPIRLDHRERCEVNDCDRRECTPRSASFHRTRERTVDS